MNGNTEAGAVRTLQNQGVVCLCVKHHTPQPLELNVHHIWPLAMGGPNVADNQVTICPSTHSSTHSLLRQMVTAGRELSYAELNATHERAVPRFAADLAQRGYRAYAANIKEVPSL